MDDVKNWFLTNLEQDTLAVMLVGSRARGTSADRSDFDIIVIKESQSSGPRNVEKKYKEYDLDIWIHGLEHMSAQLSNKITNSNQLLNCSLIISFLKEAVIWYERFPVVTPLIALARDWKWELGMEEILSFEKISPTSDWALKGYNEDWALIELAKKRIVANKPISNRRKDYPELLAPTSKQQAVEACEVMQEAYDQLGEKRKWTEFKDAFKAIRNRNYAKALASAKDVLRFVIRCQLSVPPVQLLDPLLWKQAEEANLPEKTINALESVLIS